MEYDRRIRVGDAVAFVHEETWHCGDVVEVFPLAKHLRSLPGNERVRNYQIRTHEGSLSYYKLCDTKIFRLSFLTANGIAYMITDRGISLLSEP